MSTSGECVWPVDDGDERLLGALRAMWEQRDPVPPGLADRVVFALSLEDVEVELLRLREEFLMGARGEERARTVTFTSDSLSVTITINPGRDGVRLDGWISSGAGMPVELRAGGRSVETAADEDGRFVFEPLAPGLIQLAFRLPGAASGQPLPQPRAVVTPAIQV